MDRLIRDGSAERERVIERQQRVSTWILLGSLGAGVVMLLVGGLWVLAALVVLPTVSLALHAVLSRGVSEELRRRYRDPVAAFLKAHPREDGRFGEACSDIVSPFLDRHTDSGEPNALGAGVVPGASPLVIVRSFYGRPGGRCRVPTSDASVLRDVLADAGVVIGPTPEEIHEFLAACALRLEFDAFRGRVSVLERQGLSIDAAFVALYREDPAHIPFFRELLRTRHDESDAQAVAARLAVAFKALRKAELVSDIAKRREGPAVRLTMEMVDVMEHHNFERLVGMLFEGLGYVFTEGKGTKDQGNDGIVERAGERTVIQCKHYGESQSVGNDAVQEAVAARAHFRCQFSLVATNRSFTESARELATGTGTRLLDRGELVRMIETFNLQAKDYEQLARLIAPRSDLGAAIACMSVPDDDAGVPARS